MSSNGTPKTDEEYRKERSAALEKILQSPASKKVIVAGPGCGKTHTFGEVLKQSEGKKLVLTFINNLADDLQDVLGEYAEVRTFHSFSRKLLQSLDVPGVTRGVHYYSPLPQFIVEDIKALEGEELIPDEIGYAFHTLDDSASVVTRALRSGTYYNAVSHDDSVYRVLRHLQAEKADVPVFAQIVVDEYQDFNLAEVSFIDVLAERSKTLVAGDDDQALYSFKQASPRFLRELANNAEWEKFELPFCSRCPPVMIEATHRLVAKAVERGKLAGRLDKPFVCFLPAKREETETYPKIIHARCSVQRNNAPYMSWYVAGEINKLSREDVEASRKDGNPTVLVVGPPQFVRPIGSYLFENLPNVDLRQRDYQEVSTLFGYTLLLRDEASRLGWRVVMFNDPPEGMDDVLVRCLGDGLELRDELPDDYVNWHLRHVAAIRKLKDGRSLTESEQEELESSVGMTLEALLGELGLVDVEEVPEGETDPEAPTIVATNLVGAKGLQAEHVFVVGVSGGHLP